jgi:hypothetical protein
MYDCSLEVDVGRLVGVGFIRYFVMRGLEMQLCLFECALIDWFGYVLCVARIVFGGNVISWNQYCGSLSMSGMKRKTFCTVRKGEKQVQILDGY